MYDLLCALMYRNSALTTEKSLSQNYTSVFAVPILELYSTKRGGGA